MNPEVHELQKVFQYVAQLTATSIFRHWMD